MILVSGYQTMHWDWCSRRPKLFTVQANYKQRYRSVLPASWTLGR